MKRISLILLINIASVATTKAITTDSNPPGNVVGFCAQLASNTDHGDFETHQRIFKKCVETLKQK